MAVFSTSPADFERFVTMTRSSSRSLSPEREILQMTRTSRPSLLQCGSPLYDPVSDTMRCWGDHPLRLKPRVEYGQVEGVSCDFCGSTDWLEKGTDASGKEEEGPSLMSSSRAKKGKAKAKSNAKTWQEREALQSAQDRGAFYHCDECEVDVCLLCVDDVKADTRYHVPCMQCRSCALYVREEEAVVHRCAEIRQSMSRISPAKRPRDTQDEVPTSHRAEPLISPPAAGSGEQAMGLAANPQHPPTMPRAVPHPHTWLVRVDGDSNAVLASFTRSSHEQVDMSMEGGFTIIGTASRLRAEEIARIMRRSGFMTEVVRGHM